MGRRAGLGAFVILIAGLGLGFVLFGRPGTAAAACGALPTSLGTADVNVNVASSGSYRVWVDEEATQSGSGGFYFQVPDADLCNVTMGNALSSTNTWTWVDYANGQTSQPVNVTLSQGSHELEFAGLSAGVEVDEVLLLADGSCVPTGNGSNCTAGGVSASASTTPTSPAGQQAQSSGSSPSGTQSMSASSQPKESIWQQYKDVFLGLALVLLFGGALAMWAAHLHGTHALYDERMQMSQDSLVSSAPMGDSLVSSNPVSLQDLLGQNQPPGDNMPQPPKL